MPNTHVPRRPGVLSVKKVKIFHKKIGTRVPRFLSFCNSALGRTEDVSYFSKEGLWLHLPLLIPFLNDFSYFQLFTKKILLNQPKQLDVEVWKH